MHEWIFSRGIQITHETEQNLNVIQKLLIRLGNNGNNVGGTVILKKRYGIMSCDMFGSSIDLIHHASTLNSDFDGPFKITALSYHFDIYYKEIPQRLSQMYMVPTYISSSQ